MCNFRNTREKEDCTYCKHFRSYQHIYEDALEPSEYGTCPKVDEDCIVGEGKICDSFENENINITAIS